MEGRDKKHTKRTCRECGKVFPVFRKDNLAVLKTFCALLTKFFCLSSVSGNIRDLYDYLMQKEALDERMGSHQLVRKSGRSPSLRLRFGRRSDPSLLPVSSNY